MSDAIEVVSATTSVTFDTEELAKRFLFAMIDKIGTNGLKCWNGNYKKVGDEWKVELQWDKP